MPIQLRFTLTFEDYLASMRLHAMKNWWLRLNYFTARFMVPVLGACFILLGLLSFGHGALSAFLIYDFGFGALFVLYPWYYRARLKRCYRRTRTGSGDTSVEIGEEMIRVQAENTSSEFTWKAVQLFREDQKVFMLYLAPAKFIALPKRAFTPEQIAELQSLLARRFAGKAVNPS
jgi:hypothetical protein